MRPGVTLFSVWFLGAAAASTVFGPFGGALAGIVIAAALGMVAYFMMQKG